MVAGFDAFKFVLFAMILAVAVEVVFHESTALESALCEDTSGEARTTKEAIPEFHLDELRRVEQSPVPGRITDSAITQDALERFAFHIDMGKSAVTKDVVLPALREFGVSDEISTFVKCRHGLNGSDGALP